MKPHIDNIKKIIYGHFKEAPISIEYIDMGVMTYKYRFKIKEVDYIIRVFPHTRGYIAAKEYDILKLANKNDCKVPEVIITSCTDDVYYIIYVMLPGRPLSVVLNALTKVELDSISREISENMHSLSGITFPGYGSITDENKLKRSWLEFLVENIQSNFNNLINTGLFTTRTLENIKVFMEENSQVNKTSVSQLVWSDFNADNIIIENKHLSGFIDFEGTIGGDPLLAIGYLFAIEGDSLFFQSIMGSMNLYPSFDKENVIFYSMIRLFRLVKHINEPLPTERSRVPILNFLKGIDPSIRYINNKYHYHGAR